MPCTFLVCPFLNGFEVFQSFDGHFDGELVRSWFPSLNLRSLTRSGRQNSLRFLAVIRDWPPHFHSSPKVFPSKPLVHPLDAIGWDPCWTFRCPLLHLLSPQLCADPCCQMHSYPTGNCIRLPQDRVAPFPASFVLISLVLFLNDLHGRAAKDPGLAISQILALWLAGYKPPGESKPVLIHTCACTHKHTAALFSLLSCARLTRLPESVHYSSKHRC